MYHMVWEKLWIFKNVNLFILRQRERERERVWEGQRERETQNLKQSPDSELAAQSPKRGSNPQTTSSQPEPKSDQLSHSGALVWEKLKRLLFNPTNVDWMFKLKQVGKKKKKKERKIMALSLSLRSFAATIGE